MGHPVTSEAQMSLAVTSSHCASAGKQKKAERSATKKGRRIAAEEREEQFICCVVFVGVLPERETHEYKRYKKSVDKIPDFGD